jgi:hypothetical protein
LRVKIGVAMEIWPKHVPVGFDGPCGAFEPQLVHAVGQISMATPILTLKKRPEVKSLTKKKFDKKK